MYEEFSKLFPELDSRMAKFIPGISLWDEKGLINLQNPDDVSKVRLILKVLDQTPGYDFFDSTFNDADPEMVCAIIGMSPMAPIQDEEIDFDYSVVAIRNFEDALCYFEATSWCIVISEDSYKEYTSNGNRFYFCMNKGWENVPCVPGMSFPYDRFGYSLIAVEITPEKKIASVTSRWNTCAGDTGDFLSPEELKNILGEDNYNRLFVNTVTKE